MRPKLPYLVRRSHFNRRCLQQRLSLEFVPISRVCALVSQLNSRFTTDISSEVLHGFKIKGVRTFIFMEIMRISIAFMFPNVKLNNSEFMRGTWHR
jgi:hypothetical protein